MDQDFVSPALHFDFSFAPVLLPPASFHRCWSLINVLYSNSISAAASREHNLEYLHYVLNKWLTIEWLTTELTDLRSIFKDAPPHTKISYNLVTEILQLKVTPLS